MQGDCAGKAIRALGVQVQCAGVHSSDFEKVNEAGKPLVLDNGEFPNRQSKEARPKDSRVIG